MLSAKDKYAISAMVDIAMNYSKNEYVTTKEISSRCNLSIKYLEQIIARLVKNNLLISFRGSNGGYGLVKRPEEYTVLEIIEAISGRIVVNSNEPSNYIKLMDGYVNAVNNYFSNIKLSDLVLEYENQINAGFYYI